MANKSDATKLKEAGNALFASQDYIHAYEKYSSAIALDKANAVLYTNRAACLLAMNRFGFDACTGKAIDLDPLYSKAWSRLAQGRHELGDWSLAVRAWEKALECLPSTKLTASDEKLKRQFADGLKATKKRMQDAEVHQRSQVPPVPDHMFNSGDMPWDRARAMMSELLRRPSGVGNSSAWIIIGAHNVVSENAIRYFLDRLHIWTFRKLLRQKKPEISGETNRVTSMYHPNSNWLEKYNSQVLIENQARRAWLQHGPEEVMQLAQIRLREEGWKTTRPALSVTVRAWLMRGFLCNGLNQDYPTAMNWYSHAIHLLEHGQKVWRDTAYEDRGMVFTPTFLRGVRAAHLEAFMQACAQKPGRTNKDYPLERLLELADALYLDSVREKPPPGKMDFDFATVLSFYVYPAAQALATKGWYHRRISENSGSKPAELVYHSLRSAKLYIEAARLLPEDDELHCWYLNAAANRLWFAQAPLSLMIPIMSSIRRTYPIMMRIWTISALTRTGRDEDLHGVMEFEKKVLKAMDNGQLTLSSRVTPWTKL
ncbi:hypothetical protein BD410DRAFT_730356 [Rickenella mellea]|uniref:Uncharacterized protein n=1 Tax=Rickenella mellea TaxID=50990 RepID=A0A4Y7PQ00_9AGAM|nr:hypothetical protein BD410DRAFT_730356 [Rickenella mellea]